MMLLALLLTVAPTGTVTVSLEEARGLWAVQEAPRAPMSAAVISQRLGGQVTADALEVTATFGITVLDGNTWSRLSLMKLEPGVTLVAATASEGMVITTQQQEVVFISRQPGTYTTELKLSARATGTTMRSARLSRGADAREGSLHVEAAVPDQTLQHTEVRSEAGRWTVEWKSRPQVVATTVRPPMEPVIAASRVQLVSTVEGRARMTVEYRLGLDREQPLSLRLPEEWTLMRVASNGTPRSVPSGRDVTLAVSPAAVGGRDGVVELVLERDYGVFHLSGRIAFSLPGASWPTSVVEVSVHLPSVFEYRRVGGSLEPSPEPPSAVPTLPGRAIFFRQHLVASAGPTLELSYSVDLENRYFRAHHDL
jgi:hypothetical protein